MDRLRRCRGVVQAAATKLITSATEALQAENPSPTNQGVLLDDLQDKDTTLGDLSQKIADITTDSAEYGEEVTMTLDYHNIRNAMSRVRYLLKSAARPTDGAAPGVATETRRQGVSSQANTDREQRRELSFEVPTKIQPRGTGAKTSCLTIAGTVSVSAGRRICKQQPCLLPTLWPP
ncbi:hypothetical protein HPB52_012459 [Rhipicephalus sanguineus]|uniref:Uncharacterized protein n=1 Tax=Rhipicephalus sanguineus TaxID=34632 RepID=A0A9D4T5R1_RHISA|nr:hypothetical protein HPB52_012459 [Rhipicephalus sanguineus]